jgi:metal-responsive CopG/Arc/MetJ family transcriptional regulator
MVAPGSVSSPEYTYRMRQKTSVTLSEDLLAALAQATRKGESRSQAVERLLRQTLAGEARRARDVRDLDLINRHADRLNAEAEDVLAYQVDL